MYFFIDLSLEKIKMSCNNDDVGDALYELYGAKSVLIIDNSEVLIQRKV